MTLSTCAERQFIVSSIAKVLGVSIEDVNLSKSFTELGGHSLSAVEVQQKCQNIIANPPTVLSILTSSSVEDLLPAKSLKGFYEELGSTRSNTPNTASSDIFDSSPFSNDVDSPDSFSVHSVTDEDVVDVDLIEQQAELVERTRLKVPSPKYLIQDATQLSNPTNAPATEIQSAFIQGGRSTIRYMETWRLEDAVVMKHAWKTVIIKEPIFQTVFQENTPGAYTIWAQEADFPWDETVTFDHQSYEQEIAKQNPQLQPTFQFRTVVFKSSSCSCGEATIILSVHHALLDGFSMEMLAEKVQRVATGVKEVMPGKSFLATAQEIDTLKKEFGPAAKEFWAKRIAKHPGATASLCIPKHGNGKSHSAGNEIRLDFGHLRTQIQNTCRSLGVTVASFFHAAWALVQSLYSDSNEVVFGSILSGRNLSIDGICSVIGPVLNSLPLHVSIGEDMSTSDFVKCVFLDLAELSCFQWSTPEHGFGRSFEAALSVTRGLRSSTHDIIRPVREARYDFESNIPLSIALDEAAFVLRLVYHTNDYSAGTAEGLAACFVSALERLTFSATVRQCLDSLMTVPMHGHLRILGNCISDSTTRGPHQEDLLSLFEKMVQIQPEAVAIEFGEQNVSYSDLDILASQVAAALKELGVSDETVCVHADGSLDWVIGLLGALKAEATFCSLDATLPPDLRSDMFQTAKSSVFMVGHEWQRRFVPDNCKHCLVMESIAAHPTEQQFSDRIPRPSAPAYLCFTSGSTGKPKGVLCTHQGLVAFQKDVEVRLHANPGMRVSQFMSPAFDGSIHEIFSALCYGATLVLRHNADPFQALRLVDSAIMTPSVARTISPTDFKNLKTVYLVGEQVHPSIVEQWAPGRKLYNMYGPTEGTGGATIARLLPGQPITIGRPNPTSRIYILGRHGHLMPSGAVGEIHIAGVQVALGYVHRPKETAERFLPDAVCPGLGESMYRTGDRGYWDDEGKLICLGRNDRQIKLRGFRLDLDDFEIRIMQALPTIKAVALTKAARGDTLVAMVQPASLCAESVRAAVTQKLPRHAVPSVIECVDEFPMTRAGKVDLKAIIAKLIAH